MTNIEAIAKACDRLEEAESIMDELIVTVPKSCRVMCASVSRWLEIVSEETRRLEDAVLQSSGLE